jgi:superfamily II DNA/RNA helicase
LNQKTNFKSQTLKNLAIASFNEMQEQMFDVCAAHKQVVLLSKTGSGKTLAFLIPMLEALIDGKNNQIQALIIAPTRELALQIETVFKSIKSGYKIVCCYGGHNVQIEINRLIERPAVLIGTPGRIKDLIHRGELNIQSVSTLILDEFDKTLEVGFEEEVKFIFSEIQHINQFILTSATRKSTWPSYVPLQKAKVLDFIKEDSIPDLNIFKVNASGDFGDLKKLMSNFGNDRSILFCNTREECEEIYNGFKSSGMSATLFHGGMEQRYRERALIKFRNGTALTLITTDLASRGIDVDLVQHVVHVQLPSDEAQFVHRNGRTARMNASGNVYLFHTAKEYIRNYSLQKYDIQQGLNKPQALYETLYISGGKKDKINKGDVLGFVIKIGEATKEDVGRIDVLDTFSYVAIKRSILDDVQQKLNNQKIKGRKVHVEIARDAQN